MSPKRVYGLLVFIVGGILMYRAVHITTVHPSDDTRIYNKQLRSLENAGWDTHLIVQHGQDQIRDGIQIHALDPATSRPARWRQIPTAIRKADQLDADVYQFHDPELLLGGLYLAKFTDGSVIFDIHEDYGRDITSREWIPELLKPPLSQVYPFVQALAISQLDASITVTNPLAEKFQRGENRVEVIRNYPRTSTLPDISDDIEHDHEFALVYAGGLSRSRGSLQMVRLLRELRDRGNDAILWAPGKWIDDSKQVVEQYIHNHGLEEYVEFPGYLSHTEMFSYLMSADVGVALLDRNLYRGSLPTKIFEYMYAKLPVLGTPIDTTDRLRDTYFWGVPENNTGEQADAVEKILSSDLETIGQEARQDVEDRFSWEKEEEKLLRLYQSLV